MTSGVASHRQRGPGRKLAKAFRDACAEFFPEAFANAHLTQTGSLRGIRETRRIPGDDYLTIDDFINLRSFPDGICRNCCFVDVHRKRAPDGDDAQSPAGAIRLQKGESHGIPCRCLTPQNLRNLLVAGRSISTDRRVQGSTRVMPVCLWVCWLGSSATLKPIMRVPGFGASCSAGGLADSKISRRAFAGSTTCRPSCLPSWRSRA